jgi:hypothetical protein
MAEGEETLARARPSKKKSSTGDGIHPSQATNYIGAELWAANPTGTANLFIP